MKKEEKKKKEEQPGSPVSEGKATEIQGAGRVCREHRAAPAPFWLAAQQQSSSQEWGAATEMSILGKRKQEKFT